MSSIRALSSGLVVASVILAGCVPSKPAAPVPPPVDSETLKKQADFAKTEAFYYDLQQQNFQEISCSIDVSLVDTLVQQMRAYLERVSNDKVSISDTLASYRLIYDKVSGLHIDDPTMDLTIKPGTKPADPDKVKLGKKKMEDGFKALIATSDAAILTIVHFEESSKPEDFDILYVNMTTDGYQMSFKSKKTGVQETSSLAGGIYEGKYSFPDGGQSTRTVHSKKLEDGKLLSVDAVDDGSGVMGKSSTTTTIAYQTLGAIYFPAKVETQARVDAFQTSHQSITIDYIFNKCAVK